MAEGDVPNTDPTLVERWLQDQQQWQRTLFTYLDSMMKNEEFLVHLGNAMRGSLLAGKAYPGAPLPATEEPSAPADDRLDQLLFAVHQLQGQFQDLSMTLDEIRKDLRARTVAEPRARKGRKATPGKRKATPGKRTGKTRSSTKAGAKGPR